MQPLHNPDRTDTKHSVNPLPALFSGAGSGFLFGFLPLWKQYLVVFCGAKNFFTNILTNRLRAGIMISVA